MTLPGLSAIGLQVPVVRRVETDADLARFIELPWDVYAGDPHWVPPIRDEDRHVLGRDGPFFEHAEGALFVATRGDRVVGRIAALHDSRTHDPDTGTVGYFECLDDREAALALFGAAEEWLRGRGLARVRGPLSPNILLGAPGVFVEGEPGPPTLLTAYNPPYYPSLYEAAGYAKEKDLVAYWADLAAVNLDGAADAEASLAAEGIRIRRLDADQLARDIALWGDLRNSGYPARGHYAYADTTPAEIAFIVASHGPVLDPDLIWFAERDGRPVGVCIGLVDLNPILRQLDGVMGPEARVGELFATTPLTTVRLTEFVVAAHEQARSIGFTLVQRTLVEARAKGFRRAEYSWIVEDNRPSRRSAEKAGGELARRYRVYWKALGA